MVALCAYQTSDKKDNWPHLILLMRPRVVKREIVKEVSENRAEDQSGGGGGHIGERRFANTLMQK
jgi:hypothetical protein